MGFCFDFIQLENYRCFEKREFHLNDQMNVFVGANASGKTTVLEGLCVALGAYISAYKTLVPARYGASIGESDVFLRPRENHGQDRDVFLSHSIPAYPSAITAALILSENENGMDWMYTRLLEEAGGRTKFKGRNPLRPIVEKWETALQEGSEKEKEIILPLVLYLSSARLWNEDNKLTSARVMQRWNGYDRCLDKKRGITFCFSYIKKLMDVAKEENGTMPFPAYNVIMDALYCAMKEQLPTDDKIIYSSRYEELAQQKSDGTVIPFSSLSDGYRNVMKIILDIAARMCVLNPHLKDCALRETPGVVLIDELDLSLHPNWQRSIVGILKALFPKVQFICTTHSPFIIQSLDEGELVSLDSNDGFQYSGESIEDIASDVMNVDEVRWSRAKQFLHDAALDYFENLKKLAPDDLEARQRLSEQLEILKGEYSDDVALIAFLEAKYNRRITEINLK